jgi:glycosyltransferase involved in cell wall biosynthesis
VRTKYQLPERFILNVGLIYPGKNIPNLLRALQQVRREEPDVHLVIAGTGKRMYAGDLAMIQSVELRDAVRMPGYVPHEDLVAVYSLAQAVVFPSYYESFPAIPLEANACGCPVVTSRTGGTPEAAGDAALYVDPDDVAGIAAATLRVLREPALRADMVAKGYQNARRFSWERTARATLDVLESLDRRP